jgi:hypothetical protein
MTPSPWQASQRPPLTLNEKRPARSRALASGSPANHSRIGVNAPVGRRVRARRAPDRRLVDVDDLVEILDAGDLVVLARMILRVVELARSLEERVDQQRRLAAAETPVTQVSSPSGIDA